MRRRHSRSGRGPQAAEGGIWGVCVPRGCDGRGGWTRCWVRPSRDIVHAWIEHGSLASEGTPARIKCLDEMTMLTGILQWPQRAEGRVRQLSGTALVERADDPYVPLALCERFKLRNGLQVTVEVGY